MARDEGLECVRGGIVFSVRRGRLVVVGIFRAGRTDLSRLAQ